ncbi:MAG: histidinol-phosphate transaminase, partial [Halobacteriota archaeon]|nr:histidinol-phosphate transaminase [Halobacteriota archaeon]
MTEKGFVKIKLRDSLSEMEEYVPGKSIKEVAMEFDFDVDGIIKLGSNENPIGSSPKVVEAITRHARELYIYPEICSPDLRQAISQYVGYPINNVVIGTGGDGVLDTIVRLFVDNKDETLIPIPTFSFYELVTKINGGVPRFIQRGEDFSVPIDELIDSVNDKTKVIFLCSPNNPTGNVMEEKDVRRIAESVNCTVVVDEAYVEFADRSLLHLVKEYENVIITRTFSKAFGLAGLRIGYAVIPEWMFGEYMKVNQPFGVNQMGVVAGIAALNDRDHLNRTLDIVSRGREYLTSNISFKVYPSQANFVFIDVSPLKSKDVALELLKHGIIVRDCSSFNGAGDTFLRISVGTDEQ